MNIEIKTDDNYQKFDADLDIIKSCISEYKLKRIKTTDEFQTIVNSFSILNIGKIIDCFHIQKSDFYLLFIEKMNYGSVVTRFAPGSTVKYVDRYFLGFMNTNINSDDFYIRTTTSDEKFSYLLKKILLINKKNTEIQNYSFFSNDYDNYLFKSKEVKDIMKKNTDIQIECKNNQLIFGDFYKISEDQVEDSIDLANHIRKP